MHRFLYVLLSACLVTTSSIGQSQDTLKLVTASWGMNLYKGELGSYENPTSSVHIGLKLNSRKRMSGFLQLSLGYLQGEDARFEPNQYQVNRAPNTFFSTRYFSFQYELQYNLILKNRFKAYFSLGAGLLSFTPKDENYNSLIDQPRTRLSNEEYNNESFFIPLGWGFRYLLKNNFEIGMAMVFLNPRTDYLDNISEFGSAGNDQVFRTQIHLWIPIGKAKRRTYENVPKEDQEKTLDSP